MESLETKIERLPPELQKEVEDFVDFLIAKHKVPERTQVSLDREAASPVETRSFPFFPPMAEQEPLPVPVPEPGTLMTIPGQEEEARPAGPIIFASERGTTSRQTESHAETAVREDDPLTRNYLDYGALADAQDERRPPTRPVVKNGKKGGDPEKPVELDWV